MTTTICPYCGKEAKLVGGDVIYKRRPDLASLFFWLCKECDAYVGCHKKGATYRKQGLSFVSDGTVAFGTMADFELRYARKFLHDLFDPLWKSKSMTRTQAYKWLQNKTGLSEDEAHISMMNVDTCQLVMDSICKDFKNDRH